MSQIVIDIKSNIIDIYYKSDSNNILYPIGMLKDYKFIINNFTNKYIIKIVVNLLYSLGNAIHQRYNSI